MNDFSKTLLLVVVFPLFALLTAISNSNCSPPFSNGICLESDKLDAEEAGYLGEHSKLIRLVTGHAYDIFNSLQESKKYDALEEKENKLEKIKLSNDNLKRIQELSESRLPSLDSTLPPDSIKELHNETSNLLHLIKSTQNPWDIQNKCLTLYLLAKKLYVSIKARPDQDKSKIAIPINVVYRPTISPMGMGISSNSTFSLVLAAATPLGNFSLSPSQPSGITKLIIRYGSMQRFLKIDRPFRYFFPSNYTSKYINGDGQTLIIEMVLSDDHKLTSWR